jgi:hypothetical protein
MESDKGHWAYTCDWGEIMIRQLHIAEIKVVLTCSGLCWGKCLADCTRSLESKRSSTCVILCSCHKVAGPFFPAWYASMAASPHKTQLQEKNKMNSLTHCWKLEFNVNFKASNGKRFLRWDDGSSVFHIWDRGFDSHCGLVTLMWKVSVNALPNVVGFLWVLRL